MADGVQPPWFTFVRAASTSWTRFRVLELTVTEKVTPATVARAIGCDPKAAAQHLAGLEKDGLIRHAATGGVESTPIGTETHALLRSASHHPAALLAGHRLLGVAYSSNSDAGLIRELLSSKAEILLRADGDLDLLAVLRDDPDLVSDLQHEIHERVARSIRLRISEAEVL